MKIAWVLAVGCAAAACSPGLDWREARPEGAGVVVAFPCPPDRHARNVAVAGSAVRMEMLVCAAQGTTFALSFMDVADPTLVASTITELQATALSNIGGVQIQREPARFSGMTPNAQAARISMAGRLPDGTAVQQQAAFFVKGMRVFQASVVGPQLLPDTTEPFFAGLKLPS